MKVLLFLVVMVAMMAVLMAQEDATGAPPPPEGLKCSRGESFLCFLKCITKGKVPESCNKVNGTISCICRAINATRPE